LLDIVYLVLSHYLITNYQQHLYEQQHGMTKALKKVESYSPIPTGVSHCSDTTNRDRAAAAVAFIPIYTAHTPL